mmetsp:Transcript_76298/g.181442  ORF Transcript_76298/g.181442 Transcript_76298/m.181442 type:complete len:266 (-) Transcript_76298:1088-1885(-)
MYAILSIYLKPHAAIRFAFIGNILIDFCWAKATFWTSVRWQGCRQRSFSVLRLHFEVRRLVMLMINACTNQVLQDVECDLAIGLGILDWLVVCSRLRVLGVSFGPPEGPWLFPSCQDQAAPSVCQSTKQASLEGWLHVASSLQLIPYPRRLHLLLVRCQLHSTVNSTSKSLSSRFASQHSSFHGSVTAFDLGHVEESCGTASQHPPWEGKLWNRLHATLIDTTCAIGYASSSFQHSLDARVRLHTLKLLVWAEIRIGVVQASDQA